MWVVEGALLSFWLVGFGTLVMLYLRVFRGVTGIVAIEYRIFGNL
jgi:hypothetical protein